MYKGLQAKFATYPALRSLLISTDNSILVNASQGDLFWGTSRNGVGFNQLGRMLMDLREDFLGGEPGSTYANGHAYRSGYVDPSIAL
jgi:diaminohydroxyphosphoribosylaminopyrimidine deaminase/5-amino-6-(5-phosphoribosylamino)uracil reductase